MSARPIQTARCCRSTMGWLSGDVSSVKKCRIQRVGIDNASARVVSEMTDRCTIHLRFCQGLLSHQEKRAKPTENFRRSRFYLPWKYQKSLVLTQRCTIKLLDPSFTTKRERNASQ